MINLVSIISNAIYSNCITLVFDGPGLQQGFPCVIAALRPIGYINEEIIFQSHGVGERIRGQGSRLLPSPDRESQIVANLQIDLPSLGGGDQSLIPGRIVLVFLRISKAVSFIIITKLPIRQHPYKTVE